MSEPSPELPVVPDLETVLMAPVVTFLARTSEVRLGDVVDSAHGLVHVREIVQRRQWWDLAGDRPGHLNPTYLVPVARPDSDAEPSLRRRLLGTDLIRVRRAVTGFGRLKGHSKNVHSHQPTKRGWYTDPGGYDAECSCGWSHPDVFTGPGNAGHAWLTHKAGQISEAAYADNSALLFITTAEVVRRELPAMPWVFRKITHGVRNGGGFASASLGVLSVEQARAAMDAWMAVPGLEDGTAYEERYEPRDQPFFGPRPGGTSLHRTAVGPDKCNFVLDAHIDDPDPAPEPAG